MVYKVYLGTDKTLKSKQENDCEILQNDKGSSLFVICLQTEVYANKTKYSV